jgi:hypothetical protein
VGLLSAGLLAGCSEGRTASPQVAAARARQQVEPSALALANRLQATLATRSLTRDGGYVKCTARSADLAYSASLTVNPASRTSITGLSRQVTMTMRADGWRLAEVDLAKVHFVLPTDPHPAYRVARGNLHGALNVIPDSAEGATALIFIDSPCFNAGSIATRLERGNPTP